MHTTLKKIMSLPPLTCFSIVRSGDAIYVRVGDHELTRKYGSPGAQTLRVATTYIHHNHNSQTLDNDIALLKLHGQAELKDGVCLVCLPARGVSQAAGKRCTVTGYGYMGEGTYWSAVLTVYRLDTLRHSFYTELLKVQEYVVIPKEF
jgi:secreted trypsin-like serine protease